MVPSCFCSSRDLEPHLHAQRGVEVRQRLVEQERLRLAHDRAADRDALALAAGQLARLAVEIGREVERRRRGLDLAVDLVASAGPPSSAPKAMLPRTLICG